MLPLDTPTNTEYECASEPTGFATARAAYHTLDRHEGHALDCRPYLAAWAYISVEPDE